MDRPENSLLLEQLKDLETQVPHYDYEGLSLPQGLTVDAYFGSHANIGDLQETRAMLKDHDIVIVESVGWDEPTMKLMQKIANGNYAMREKMLRTIALQKGQVSRSDHLALAINATYDIRKPMMVIDPPHNHRVSSKLNRLFSSPNSFPPDFNDAITKHRVKMEDHAKMNLERENYMLRSFCDQFTDKSKQDPKFAAKLSDGGVSVAMFDFGLTHSALYLGLQEVARRSGVSLEGSLYIDTGPEVVVDHQAQASGRYVYGLEIDDTLVAKDMMTKVLARRLLNESGSTEETGLVGAVTTAIHYVEAMDLSQMEELYSTFTGQPPKQ